MQPTAAHPDCRVHGRRLLDLTQEARQCCGHCPGVQRRSVAVFHDDPLSILRVGGGTEDDRGLVCLVTLGQEVLQLHRVVDADREDAGGRGVEGAGVAGLRRAQQPPHALHHVEAGGARGLVDDEDTAGEHRSLLDHETDHERDLGPRPCPATFDHARRRTSSRPTDLPSPESP
jgi:hypothetical protein